MDAFQEFSSTTTIDGQLSNNEVNNIYQSLSSPASFEDIDTNDEMNYVQNCIDNLFDSKFKLISTDELSKNQTLLNNKFVELIKYCKQTKNYKKVGYIFIGFCYYFDLDEFNVYNNLHEKLQMLIKQATLRMCGKNIFKRNLERKQEQTNGVQVVSLFSLANH